MATVHVSQSQPRSIPIWTWLSKKNRGYLLAGYSFLFLIGAWTAFPVYWQLATSFRSDADLYTPVVNLIPRAWTLEHYYNVLFGAMAGYALTRLQFLGRAGLARVLVFSYLAPSTILFIPIYVMANNFGMRDTLSALVMSHLTFSVPFATWILMGYFKTIPVELEEAALVDGASRWILLWRIILPLAAPAVVVVAIFAFTGSWRDLLYALVLTQAKDKMTGPIGLTAYVVGDTFYWGQMMAAATLLSIPPLFLYIFGQRWVIQGWTAGAVKS